MTDIYTSYSKLIEETQQLTEMPYVNNKYYYYGGKSAAAMEAKQAGLKYAGYAKWKNPSTGEIVAKTVDGKLVWLKGGQASANQSSAPEPTFPKTVNIKHAAHFNANSPEAKKIFGPYSDEAEKFAKQLTTYLNDTAFIDTLNDEDGTFFKNVKNNLGSQFHTNNFFAVQETNVLDKASTYPSINIWPKSAIHPIPLFYIVGPHKAVVDSDTWNGKTHNIDKEYMENIIAHTGSVLKQIGNFVSFDIETYDTINKVYGNKTVEEPKPIANEPAIKTPAATAAISDLSNKLQSKKGTPLYSKSMTRQINKPELLDEILDSMAPFQASFIREQHFPDEEIMILEGKTEDELKMIDKIYPLSRKTSNVASLSASLINTLEKLRDERKKYIGDVHIKIKESQTKFSEFLAKIPYNILKSFVDYARGQQQSAQHIQPEKLKNDRRTFMNAFMDGKFDTPIPMIDTAIPLERGLTFMADHDKLGIKDMKLFFKAMKSGVMPYGGFSADPMVARGFAYPSEKNAIGVLLRMHPRNKKLIGAHITNLRDGLEKFLPDSEHRGNTIHNAYQLDAYVNESEVIIPDTNYKFLKKRKVIFPENAVAVANGQPVTQWKIVTLIDMIPEDEPTNEELPE